MLTRVPTHRRPKPTTGRSWRCVRLVVGVLLVFGTPAAVGLVLTAPEAPSAHPAQGSRATSHAERADGETLRTGRHERVATLRWQAVLRRLDLQREKAWQSGRTQRLARVFVPGSAVLRRDAAHLAAYERRGFCVSGVAMAYWRVRVVGHRRGLVRLRVVDRLQAAAVQAHRGAAARLLPTDRPSRQLITLIRGGAGWRIADIALWPRHTRPRPGGSWWGGRT